MGPDSLFPGHGVELGAERPKGFAVEGWNAGTDLTRIEIDQLLHLSLSLSLFLSSR